MHLFRNKNRALCDAENAQEETAEYGRGAGGAPAIAPLNHDLTEVQVPVWNIYRRSSREREDHRQSKNIDFAHKEGFSASRGRS